MSNSILNNVAAMGASRQLGLTSMGLQKTIERLTTGKRINRASDDAAGLAIANGLGADIRIAAQGRRNANDALLTLQTNDGYLEEATNLALRATELAAQGSSAATDAEWASVTTAINAIMGKVSTSVTASAGAFGTITTTVTAPTDLAGTLGAAAAKTTLDSINKARGEIGAGMQALNSYSNVLGIQVENTTAQYSNIMDANVADEVVNLSKWQILNQSGISALGQANQAGQALLALLR